MGMYLIAPPIAFAVIAVVAALVIAIASRVARRADWLDEQGAPVDSFEAEEAQGKGCGC